MDELSKTVDTHRELVRESSVYEDITVDVETLGALCDVAEAARRLSFPSNTTAEFAVGGFDGALLKAALDALDRLTGRP